MTTQLASPQEPWGKPVCAAVLAARETRRRDSNRELGPWRTGCPGLDDGVLLCGGLERGSVVGISAEDEDGFGMVLVMQIVADMLATEAGAGALVITPRPAGAVLRPLRQGIAAALGGSRDDRVGDGAEEMMKVKEEEEKRCLDRVMLSCVFDVDGLCEVLDELERQAAASTPIPMPTPSQRGDTGEALMQMPSASMEIQDSQDEDDALDEGPPTVAADADRAARSGSDVIQGGEPQQARTRTPEIVVITHISSILTGLFTQREKSAAHDTLRRLASRLRHLSRTLPSRTLFILLNSTDSVPAQSRWPSSSVPHPPSPELHAGYHSGGPTSLQKAVDPTLQSVFALSAFPGGRRPSKPSFGMVFAQLLDLHLLCTRVPRARSEAKQLPPMLRYVTVVEVLLDELGLWEGKRGSRRSREQTWAAFHVRGARIVDIEDPSKREQENDPS